MCVRTSGKRSSTGRVKCMSGLFGPAVLKKRGTRSLARPGAAEATGNRPLKSCPKKKFCSEKDQNIEA